MKVTTEPTTMRHKVGTCPACREGLWAEVDVVTRVSEPTISVDGKPYVYATPAVTAMRVAHSCQQDTDA